MSEYEVSKMRSASERLGILGTYSCRFMISVINTILSCSISTTFSCLLCMSCSLRDSVSSQYTVHTSQGTHSGWKGQRARLFWKNSRLMEPLGGADVESAPRRSSEKSDISRFTFRPRASDSQHTYVKSMKSQSTST